MAGYLDASGLKHFKMKNDAAYLGKQEKAASAKVADSVVWENVSGRPDLSALIPPGTIIHYAGRTVPSGWLICNGANVSRTNYAALFAAIGGFYGTGDGVTTFGLPNLNGRFLESTTSTSEVGTYKSAGLPNITGWFHEGQNSTSIFSAAPVDGATFSYSPEEGTGGQAPLTARDGRKCFFRASGSNALFGAASTIQPSAMASLILIKS